MCAKTQQESGGGSKAAKKPRIVYFDVLRAVTPLAIIVIHILEPIFHGEIDFDSSEYFWAHAIIACMRWAVPIFIMMSGALFLDPARKFDLKTHYRKYILRLVLAYVVWSVVYAIGLSLTTDGSSSEKQWLFLEYTFGNHYYHLWFLVMLIAMYILVPILRKITADRELMKYFLYVGVVVCFALPLITDYCRILMEASSKANAYVMGPLSGLVSGMSYLTSKMPLNYMVYFVLGYYLATEDFSAKKRYWLYALGLGSLAVNIFLSPIRGRLLGASMDFDSIGADLQNINFLPLCISVAVFIFMRYWLKPVQTIPKPIAFMAKHSFGVYLVHYALISFVLYYFIFTSEMTTANMWYLTPVFTAIVYLASLSIAWALSKIPLLKKVV